MLTIDVDKFDKLTEIVARWCSNSDAAGSTVKSMRDKLLPLVCTLRGLCVTPVDIETLPDSRVVDDVVGDDDGQDTDIGTPPLWITIADDPSDDEGDDIGGPDL